MIAFKETLHGAKELVSSADQLPFGAVLGVFTADAVLLEQQFHEITTCLSEQVRGRLSILMWAHSNSFWVRLLNDLPAQEILKGFSFGGNGVRYGKVHDVLPVSR